MKFTLVCYTKHVPQGRVCYEGDTLPISQLSAINTLREFPRLALLIENELAFELFEVRSGVLAQTGRIVKEAGQTEEQKAEMIRYATAA